MYALTGQDTLTEYGPKYQFRLLYYTCSLSEFGRSILPHLTSDMFDQQHFKQLVTLIRAYWQQYGQLPNVDNLRLMLQQDQFLSPVDQEILEGELGKFNQLRAMLANGTAHNDSQHVIDLVWGFVRQRQMRTVQKEIDSMVLTGTYEENARGILTKFQTAMQLGIKEHVPSNPARDMHDIWLNRYPNAVPTGIPEFDHILPGGLPPGKLGLFVGGQGVGKSSLLTLIADNAWAMGYKVLHVVFDENDPDTEVTPKYHAKWSKVPVDDMRYQIPLMEKVVKRVTQEREGKGCVSIMRFDSADTTVRVLKTWIQQYEQQYGIHYDLIVLDYIDEVMAESRGYGGVNPVQAEVEVVRAFHSMLVDLKRPGWTATQGTKGSNIKRLLYYDDMGGSAAKLKKAQVIFTIGADLDQKQHNQVNIVFLKSNISKCGHIWEDCHFSRDTLELRIGQQHGYAPQAELEKVYDQDEGEAPPQLAAAPAASTPPPPAARPQPVPAATVPVPAESTASGNWRASLPPSSFDDEGPAAAPVAEASELTAPAPVTAPPANPVRSAPVVAETLSSPGTPAVAELVDELSGALDMA